MTNLEDSHVLFRAKEGEKRKKRKRGDKKRNFKKKGKGKLIPPLTIPQTLSFLNQKDS